MLSAKKQILLFFKYTTLALFFSIICIRSAFPDDIKESQVKEYRAKGLEAQQKGNLQEALAYFYKALELGDNADAVLLNDMGVLSEQLGFPGKAEPYYKRAIEADELYLPAYSNLAYLYKSAGYTEKAFEYFKRRYELSDLGDPWGEKAKEEMVNIHPEYLKWAVNREAEILNNKIVAEAQKKFYEDVKRAQEHAKKGRKYLSSGMFEDALNEFDKGLQLTPDAPALVQARKETIAAIRESEVQKRRRRAVQMLNAGDYISANKEMKAILATTSDISR
jgi:tetratricopeptide (TPR) repeat protein